ncbi:MAG: asparagine synthase (glutamine-hydrolyzing) [Phycisphaerales bacterium]|nr:asparagine synthase (glutamine-hydrolyzing) [Phycisphaerales bacterium]
MCGIAGIFRATGVGEADRASLKAMLCAMPHRGPDGQGTFVDGPVTMGMVRLSIIDLAGGQQPLYNEDKSVTLVCNGEVYNFVELRAELERRGHRFRTSSDCETVAHLYEEHGDDFVQHLRGMYAGALWDAKRQRLVVFRDRLGEKPLYVYEADGVVVFASELRTLMAGAASSGGIPPELDAAAINDYFHFAYPVEPLTPFKHVRKLRAGHLLVLERDEAGKVRSTERSYWNLLDAPALDGDPRQLVEQQLDEVSRLIIRSDVPVGVALSSGLDSSLIALLAARAAKETGKGEIHAFTVGYKGRPECDERADAKALADHLGIPFHPIEIDEREMLDQFVDMVIARDDPIADISGQGYFAVARASRQAGVPVLLLGHGGDELFWGYPWVRDAVKETERKRRFRSSRAKGFLSYSPFKSVAQMGGRRPWARSLGGLSHAWPTIRRDLRSPKGQCVFYDITPDFSRVAASTEWLFTRDFLSAVEQTPPHRWFTYESDPPRADLAATQQIIDIYLRENGFAQGDRLTMASSVEARLPLSDYRLAETVIGLRKTQRDDHLPPKHWLRQVMEDVLPPWVLTRPKRGFSPPTQTWVASLTAKFGHLLPEGELVQRGILRAEAAEKLVREGVRPGEIMPLVFKAAVLEIWLRRVLGR